VQQCYAVPSTNDTHAMLIHTRTQSTMVTQKAPLATDSSGTAPLPPHQQHQHTRWQLHMCPQRRVCWVLHYTHPPSSCKAYTGQPAGSSAGQGTLTGQAHQHAPWGADVQQSKHALLARAALHHSPVSEAASAQVCSAAGLPGVVTNGA
jgi:hypothetical protein